MYRKTLTPTDDFVDGQLLDSTIPRHLLARVLSEESGNINDARKSLEMFARPGGAKSISESAKQALLLLHKGERPVVQSVKPDGSLYKVDLPDEAIAKMLDWDKPLSQQSKEVQSAIKKSQFFKDAMARFKETGQWYDDPRQKTGESLLKYLRSGTSDFAGGASQYGMAEDYLKQQGIPGIRYLDAGSRGAGAGTSNFVVFPGEERLLKILERNNQPIKKGAK